MASLSSDMSCRCVCVFLSLFSVSCSAFEHDVPDVTERDANYERGN